VTHPSWLDFDVVISAQLKIPPLKLVAMNYFETWGPWDLFVDTSIAIKLTPCYTYSQRFSRLNLITLSIRLPVSYSNNLSIYVASWYIGISMER
jgi:hypothetical protein